MLDAVFKGLKNVSWQCVQCGLPNFSTFIFDTTFSDTSDSFPSLWGATQTDREISFNCPAATSSPRNLREKSMIYATVEKRYDLLMRILVVNCQTIKGPGKTALLQNMVDATQANIIIGTESWLDGSIKSSEVFLTNFRSYRRDRDPGIQGGDVVLLISDKYPSDEPKKLKMVHEPVWSKVKIRGAQDLYIGTFYKSPSTKDPEYLDLLSSSLSKIPRGAHLWLGGDFNLADIDWENEIPLPRATNAAQCLQLLSVI